MDDRARIARVLAELREFGVDELFLDGLTSEEARRLVGGGRRETDRAGRSVSQGAFRGRPLADAPDTAVFPAPPSEGPSDEPSEGSSLTAIRGEATGCVKCRLSEGRTQVVFGRGSPAAKLVVVGEAPGAEEDRTGLPFVGAAGKLLDLLLLSVGVERDRAYICNVLKCRPPNNRDPQPDEVATCAPYLQGQLDAIQPRVLLAVGKFAAQWLTGTEQSIGRLRGSVHEYRGIPVVATYHPAYLLRSPDATRKTWQDLQLMRQVMDEHA